MARAEPPPAASLPSPNEAEQAFLALRPELDALTEALPRIAVDVQAAAAIAHGVVVRDREPPRWARFEPLVDAGLYDPHLPERVVRLALGTWLTRQRQRGHLGRERQASALAPVLRQARLRRRTMLKVLDHWLGDDPAVAAEVAAIRQGTGRQDLANDLETLAALYERPAVQQVVRRDHKHYRDDDVATARALARSIFAGLGLQAGGEAERWGAWCRRAFTLLVRDYGRHQSAGTFLFGEREDVRETYPSLVTAARRAPSRRSSNPMPQAIP